ncbi:PAS domain-containing sensor histidine kinase [Spirosoma sordidisoli]|uniref:histidine kinase n=1 Tax=Spirosoma sordidisoli TaxID=2502893 RepID=A0A4Q2UL23_9BACT|nr:PAS domain-containing protein [Spirosoma sordidisoli]RYC68361.1 PAS domain S-box protein [Spirosoma sordidisoli]
MNGDVNPLGLKSLTERLDLNFVLQAAGLGVWELDPQTNQVDWDDRCQRLFGVTNTDSLSYEQAVRHIHPDDLGRVQEAVQHALTAQADGRYDITHRTLGAEDNQLRWVRFWGQAYFGEEGKAYRLAGVAQDVTEQVLARQQVEERERRFQSLIEQAPVATSLFVGRDLVISIANEPMLQFWGKGSGVLGKPLAEVLPELREQPFLTILDNVYTTGNPYQAVADRCELIIDGELRTFYFNFTYQPIFDEQEQVYGVMNMAVDVTDQVLAQQLVKESQVQLLSLFEQSPVGIAIISEENLTYQMANPFYGALVGRRPEQLVGKPLLEALPELAGQGFDLLLREVIETGVPFSANEVAVDLVRNDRLDRIYVDLLYQPRIDIKGIVSEILVVATDVTQQVMVRRKIEDSEERYRTLSGELEQEVQRRTEELMAANEELAATNEELASTNDEYARLNDELGEANELFSRSNQNLEQFAYIASHDLQEPLRKVQQFGDLLQAEYSQQLGEGRLYVERMQAAANRMSTLIRDLLNFSRVSMRQEMVESVPLTDVVNTVLTDLELVIQEKGAVVRVEPLPVIEGDQSQLEQLFQNLLSNALKFTQPGRVPQIDVRLETLSAFRLPPSVKPARLASSYYRIDVVDNGIGFDEKYLDRIFQVFQRLHNKRDYAGTGIGLAICEKVAVNHGGAITAASEPGQGATFSVFLPV